MTTTWQLPTINLGDDAADAEIVDLDEPRPTSDGEECPCGDEDHTPLRCPHCGLMCQSDCHVRVLVSRTEYRQVIEITFNGKRSFPCVGYKDYYYDSDNEGYEDISLHCDCGQQLRAHCIEEI